MDRTHITLLTIRKISHRQSRKAQVSFPMADEFRGAFRSFSLLLLGLMLFAFGVPAAAQQQAGNGVPIQTVVSVEAKGNKPMPVITQQDVVVYQGHDRRPVTGWVPAKGDKAGLALAILIDDSAGFSFGTQLDEIRAFIRQQAPTTLVAVGYMQNGTVFLTQNFTQDHEAAAKSVRLTLGYYGAEASPWLSLSAFIKKWPADPAIPRREVLMITSGIDTVYVGVLDNPYVDAAIQDSQCAGIIVYSIYTPSAGHFGHSGFRTYWGQNYLGELSDSTGGESYYFLGPQAPVSFAPYLKRLNEQLPNQYLLTFLAKPEKKAGRQSFKVTSELHGVDFLHQQNVCVPASPDE
jgi:hypothetical protein